MVGKDVRAARGYFWHVQALICSWSQNHSTASAIPMKRAVSKTCCEL